MLMRLMLSILFAVFVCISPSSSLSANFLTTNSAPILSKSHNHVLILDSSTFDEVAAKYMTVLVLFFDPGSIRIANLVMEFEEASYMLRLSHPNLALAKVDTSIKSNQKLSRDYGVTDLCSLKAVGRGRITRDYYGSFLADDIVEYMTKLNGAYSLQIKSKKDLFSFILGKKIAIVGVFPEVNKKAFDEYFVFAGKLRLRSDFAHTSDSTCIISRDESNLILEPFIRVFKTFEKVVVDFKVSDYVALKNFIENATLPIAGSNQDTVVWIAKFINSPYTKAILFMNFTDEVFADALIKTYQSFAEQHQWEDMRFRVIDGESDQVDYWFPYLGVKKDQMPLIFIQHLDGRKYLMQNVKPHDHRFDHYLVGDLPQFYKSAPIPKRNDGLVKDVVSDNLKQAVLKSRKDVLLIIYYRWCPRNQQLNLLLINVAKWFKHDPQILIAKLDIFDNDIPDYFYSGHGIRRNAFYSENYPVIYFKLATSNLIKKYDGELDKNAIIRFVEKNTEM